MPKLKPLQRPAAGRGGWAEEVDEDLMAEAMYNADVSQCARPSSPLTTDLFSTLRPFTFNDCNDEIEEEVQEVRQMTRTITS